MEIIKETNGAQLTIEIKGRLDTNAAPKLIDELNKLLVEGVERFVLDMKDCDYVASSGLRAILGAQKQMNVLQGEMIVKNVMEDVMEVFEMTGFVDILTFE